MHAHMHTPLHSHLPTAWLSACTYARTYVCTHVCIYARTSACTYLDSHPHAHPQTTAACTFASQLPRATAAAAAGDVLVDEEDWLVEGLETGQVQPRLSLLSRAEFDSLSNVYLLPPTAAGSLLCHT